MSMPEAPVHEDRRAIFWQDDVWSAGKVAPMQTKPKTKTVQRTPD
jgi:hypothetical protein